MGTAPIGRMNDWKMLRGSSNTLSYLNPTCLKCGYIFPGFSRYKCHTAGCPDQEITAKEREWLIKNRHKFGENGQLRRI
jgi:hypothetical protein